MVLYGTVPVKRHRGEPGHTRDTQYSTVQYSTVQYSTRYEYILYMYLYEYVCVLVCCE